MSTYNTNVPLGPQTLSETHEPIRNNFDQLNTQFSIDHIALTAATNNGKHTKVTLRESLADATTIAGEGVIYTKTSGGKIEAFYRYPSNGAIIPITGSSPKGWCVFNNCNNANPTLLSGFNITNITRVNLTYTLHFTTALSNTNYAIFPSSTGSFASTISYGNKTVNDCEITINGLVFPSEISVLIIG